jgi:hypothetical protein
MQTLVAQEQIGGTNQICEVSPFLDSYKSVKEVSNA